MAEENADTAGAIAKPPYIYLLALALGLGIEAAFPLDLLPLAVQLLLGLSLAALGFLLIRLGFREFRRHGTEVDLAKPTTALVTTGPYRYSRNPLYIALSLILVGIGVAADSVWVVAMLAPTLVVMHYGVILREERYLERKFGEAYHRYKGAVRRWL